MTRTNEHGQPVGDAVARRPGRALAPLVLEGHWVRLEPLAGAHADDLGQSVSGPGTEPHWT